MRNDITLIAPKIKGFSGTKSYVENAIEGLKLNDIRFDLKYIKKVEISLFGKPYFGIITQGIRSSLVNTNGRVIHALSPEVVSRNTNVVTIHDVIPFTKPEIYMKTYYDKVAYNLAFKKTLKVDNLLVSTEYGKRQLMTIGDLGNRKIHVVPHSIRHTDFYYDPSSPFANRSINVVMLSDYNPRKKIDKIVEVLRGSKEISFYHIGPSQSWVTNYERIAKLAEGFDNIHLMGPLPVEQVRRYLSNANAFIYLSEEEGFGYPVLEALACGTSVLINDIPVFKELFSEVASFCKLDEFSVEDVLSASKIVNRDRFESFSQRFSVKEMGRNLSSVYEKL